MEEWPGSGAGEIEVSQSLVAMFVNAVPSARETETLTQVGLVGHAKIGVSVHIAVCA